MANEVRLSSRLRVVGEDLGQDLPILGLELFGDFYDGFDSKAGPIFWVISSSLARARLQRFGSCLTSVPGLSRRSSGPLSSGSVSSVLVGSVSATHYSISWSVDSWEPAMILAVSRSTVCSPGEAGARYGAQ